MQQSIEKEKRLQAIKSHFTVIFPDRSVILGDFDSCRHICRFVSLLSVTVKQCAHSAPAPASLPGLLTKTLKPGGYIGKAVSKSLSHQQKVSTEARHASSAVPAFERAPNSGCGTVACNQNTQESEQRCCFAAC